MRDPLFGALGALALLALVALPGRAEAGWKTDTYFHLDALMPDQLSYTQPGYLSSASLPGTSIRVEWGQPGCWNPREYVGNTKKNLSSYYRKLEITAGPTCVDGDGVTRCTVSGTGMQGPEQRAFQLTMAAAGSYCGTQVLVTGSPADMQSNGALLSALATGFAAEGTRAGKVAAAAPPPPVPPPAAPPPPPDDYAYLDALGYGDVDAGPPPFDPSGVPDLKRKVPGPCSAFGVENVGWSFLHTITWTWDGERKRTMRDEWTTSDQRRVFAQEDYTYDDAGRLIKTAYSDESGGGGMWTERVYDAAGRVAVQREFMDGNLGSETTFVYDAAGRKVKESLAYTGQPPEVTTFEYDAQGRLVRKVAPYGEVRSTYDAQGRLVQEGKATLTWSADGRTRTRVSPGSDDGIPGSTDTQVFDAYGNLLHHASSSVDSFTRTYDYGCWVK